MEKIDLTKHEIPEAFDGLKATGKAMPSIKNFFKVFISDLDLQNELHELNSKKERFDAHGSKF